MGRPPIGKVAMTSTERSHRYRAQHAKPAAAKPDGSATAAAQAEIARLKAEIARLKAAQAKQPAPPESAPPSQDSAKDREIARLKARIAELERRGEGQLTRGRREEQFSERRERLSKVDFSEVGKLRAENGRLKSDIIKLKMMLQEEPDAAKLRKKVIDQQVEVASMRQVMKKIAKERDEYRTRANRYAQPKYAEARRLLTRDNHNVIVKALRPDLISYASPTELATAAKLVTALRPLFE
jgi:hypothetical protein